MEKAAFSLDKYNFPKVSIDLAKKNTEEIDVSFEPHGIFNSQDSTFELKFDFSAFDPDDIKNPFIAIECVAYFKFVNVKSLEDIPSFFYRNSIALVFPYLRAFVSMVTLQANIPPLILPTMNLSALEEPLRQRTTQQ